MLFKKVRICLFFALFILLCGCNGTDPSSSPPADLEPEETPVTPEPEETPEPYVIKDAQGMTIETRFAPPETFSRVPAEEGSFGAYLRALPLKPDGDVVYLYDGTLKLGGGADAVLKMELNPRGFMRNTNFLLRLRGEYLYEAERYGDIEFHFLSGFVFPFTKWAEGGRVNVDNNKVDWSAPAAEPDDSPESLKNYLHTLFIYSNASAIRNDLLQAVRVEMGYVFLNYGGAVVADMATDEDGRAAILLVRGGDPEQEGYVMRNVGDTDNSPWFIVPANGILQTEEGELSVGDLFFFKK